MKTLYINLDSRPDRRKQAEAEFKRVGLNPQRVSACTGDNKPLAFNQSVLKCMGMARGEDLLLFEDDVVFDYQPSDFTARLSINMQKLPPETLTLHLGANIMGTDVKTWQMPTPFSDHLAKLHNCWQSHATLYSAACVEYILQNFRGDILTAENPIFDEWVRMNILPLGKSYVMKPMIAYQRPDKSDIWGHHADYVHYHTEGNEYLKTL